jgi:hypothetical protein
MLNLVLYKVYSVLYLSRVKFRLMYIEKSSWQMTFAA